MEFVISDNKGPIFRQIADYIIKLLAVGRLTSGGKLPSTRELAVSLNVNPNTVVAAYKHLESEGIAETRRGLGTFVKDEVMIDELKVKVLKEYAQNYCQEFVEIGVDIERGIAILKEVYDEHQGE